MAISEPFAKVLAAGRTQFNLRVAEARRRYPAFDTSAFADFLQDGVDCVVLAVAHAAPERVASTSLVAYDFALDLVGQALAGPKARSPLVNQVWQDIAPAYARLAAENPVEVLGLLSNAAINIGKVASARCEQWAQEMTAISPKVESLPQLQAIGQVLAWRAGLAHFRLGAIQAADQLPEALALAAMAAPATTPWAELKSRLLANPWHMPDNTVSSSGGIEIGQFTGFGGEFSEPPEIRACPEGFFIKSGTRYAFLIADAFGAVLHSATAEEFEHAQSYKFPKATINGSRITLGKRTVDLDLPANQLAAVCNADTAAVMSPYTHAIRLLPLQ